MSFYGQTVYYSTAPTWGRKPRPRAGEFLETDAPIAFDVATVNAYGKLVATAWNTVSTSSIGAGGGTAQEDLGAP